MSLETRRVGITFMDPYNPVSYDDFLPFGWEQIDTEIMGMNEYAILARETSMPHYQRIAYLDDQYFALKSQLRVKARMRISTLLILSIFMIVPGVLYIGYFIHNSSSVKKWNKAVLEQMDEIANEAISLQLPNKSKEPAEEKESKDEDSSN